jgi:hypothetical protein
MDTFDPNKPGKNKVSIRILFSQEDYMELKRIAKMERTDISNLVRRAVAHHFFIPAYGNTVKQS